MCEKSLNSFNIMQKWLAKNKIELSIGTFPAFRVKIEVQIYKI